MADPTMIRACAAFALALGLALLAKYEPLFAAPLGAIGSFANEPIYQDPAIASKTEPPNISGNEQPRGNPLWAVPLSSLTATRERPIFSPTRRPPLPAVLPAIVRTPAPLPQAPVKPERPPLELVGTVASNTEGIAVFIDPTTRATVRLKMGEGYTGWILRSVQGRAVTLQKGGQAEMLALPKLTAGKSVSSYGDSMPGSSTNPSLVGKPLLIPSTRK